MLFAIDHMSYCKMNLWKKFQLYLSHLRFSVECAITTDDVIVDKHLIAVPSADREPWSLAEGTLRAWSPNGQKLRV